MPKESGWVTINGVHVFIDNSGKISKGPAKFIGSSLSDLPSSGNSAADRKAELRAKYGDKKSGAKTESSSDSRSDSNESESTGGSTKRTHGVGDRPSPTSRGAVAGIAKFRPASEKMNGVKEKVKEAVETGKKKPLRTLWTLLEVGQVLSPLAAAVAPLPKSKVPRE